MRGWVVSLSSLGDSEFSPTHILTSPSPPPFPVPSAPTSVSGAGFSGLLSTMQTEWDSLMVETFNLKSALEETRRELSQALYQNDAAVRVIARLSMERDQARQVRLLNHHKWC